MKIHLYGVIDSTQPYLANPTQANLSINLIQSISSSQPHPVSLIQSTSSSQPHPVNLIQSTSSSQSHPVNLSLFLRPKLIWIKKEGKKEWREDTQNDSSVGERTMCAVLSFPLGFSETTHRFEEGYL